MRAPRAGPGLTYRIHDFRGDSLAIFDVRGAQIRRSLSADERNMESSIESSGTLGPGVSSLRGTLVLSVAEHPQP